MIYSSTPGPLIFWFLKNERTKQEKSSKDLERRPMGEEGGYFRPRRQQTID